MLKTSKFDQNEVVIWVKKFENGVKPIFDKFWLTGLWQTNKKFTISKINHITKF